MDTIAQERAAADSRPPQLSDKDPSPSARDRAREKGWTVIDWDSVETTPPPGYDPREEETLADDPPVEPTASPEDGDAVSHGSAVECARTDLGNARRLIQLHGRDLRYFPARRTWYVWDAAQWRADETGEVMRRAKRTVDRLWSEAKVLGDETARAHAFRWAATSQSGGHLDQMVKLAETEPGVAVTPTQLDADPWLLNCPNGVLDLRDGTLRPPTRELLQTKITATAYNPDARSELWDRVVADVTGGDPTLAGYMQRALGYALYGAWREKSFWFGYGPPDGGKSTFLGVVGDVLGDYHVSAAASTWMRGRSGQSSNRGDLVRLLGARLVTTFEVQDGMKFDEEIVKRVTGGDKITAAAKYENEVEFRPAFALWLAANDRPHIEDDDEGMWARMRCVPFTKPVAKEQQDPKLRERLTSPEHAPAVLAWLVQGCLAWQRDGLGACPAVQGASTEYREAMNPAKAFFDDAVEVTRKTEDMVATHVLRNCYERWCRANGVRRPLKTSAWRKNVLALGASGGDDTTRLRGVRQWCGIKIRPEWRALEDDVRGNGG